MDDKYRQLIKEQYLQSRDNSIQLFKAILSIGKETGLEAALGYLEECSIEKRVAWLDRYESTFEKTGNPLVDGYKAFYERYLGLCIPGDGEIIEASDRRIVMRWWNKCPTLESCRALGLDTREICKKVYERPVQILLSRVDERLRFKRNYEAIRPYAPYCEEVIELEGT